MDYEALENANWPDYKEKLEEARELYKTANDDQRYVLESLFPELKENEDEKIRKKLINFVKKSYEQGGYALHKYEADRMIAWLEKQGETYTKKDVDDAFVEGMAFAKKELEKQSNKETLCDKCRKEQPSHSCQDITANEKCYIEGMNTSNNVKPKFHEGEWVTNGDYTWKIIEVQPLDYILQPHDGIIVDDTISYVDEQFHLWTIEDAKDGDVLVSQYNKPFIYNGNYNSHHIGSYCGIATDNTFRVSTGKCNWTDAVNIHPATKEQRDILFTKMKEAGYEWDSEKKELRKLPTLADTDDDTVRVIDIL